MPPIVKRAIRPLVLVLVAAAVTACTPAADIDPNGPTLVYEDLVVLEGDEWEGSLTYVDYSSGETVEIPARLRVRGDGGVGFDIAYIYPEEPNANSQGRIVLSEGGRMMGNEIITQVTRDDGMLTVETTGEGRDGGKRAIFTFRYEVAAERFTMARTVSYRDGTETLVRNRFAFTRELEAQSDAP